MKIIIYFFAFIVPAIIYSQDKPIVSLTTGNYWIYQEDIRSGTIHNLSLYIYTAAGDTIFKNLSCQKIERIYCSDTKKDSVYLIYYSDKSVFSQLFDSGYTNFYDSRITKDSTISSGYVPTQGIVERRIFVGSEYIFDGIYKTQYYGSSNNRASSSTTYSEKYGLLRSSGTADYGGYSEMEFLASARIDGKYYGKLPPLIISDYEVNDHTLEINFELFNKGQQFCKLISYKYNPNERKYVAFDSTSTSISRISKLLFPGEYDLCFSYKTSSGAESMLSNNIKITVAPASFFVYQNYPNPFNGHTKIPFETLLFPLKVNLSVINILGQVIYQDTITTDRQGIYEFDVNLGNSASGVYIYKIGNDYNRVFSKKMILIK